MTRLFLAIIDFFRFFGSNMRGLINVLGSMYGSRMWLLLYSLGFLLFLIAGAPLIAGIVGQFYPRPVNQASMYNALAEREDRAYQEQQKKADSKQSEEEKQAILKDFSTSAFGNLLYRRLLQLSNASDSAKYSLAVSLAREGKLPQARQQMSLIAPPAGGGFAPAHAWLAVEMLERSNELKEEDRPLLMKHLEEAEKWEGTGPSLRAAYAELLAGQGDAPKAVEVLEKATKQDPKLRVMLTALATQAGLSEKAAEVSGSTEFDLEARISGEKPDPEDVAQLATLMLVKGDTKRCIELAEKGLKLDPTNPTFRRLGSNALLVEFRKSVNEKNDGLELNLDLLDAALKADPTTPELSVDLARAINLGIQLPPEMTDKLEDYLASGRASGLLHLMFANQKIIKGDITGSVPHLEIADRLAPKSPVIMNNLALALAMTDRSQVDRALGLIGEAVQIAGEQIDLVDTQGQINLIAQRPVEAIACFEKVLTVNPKAVETRKMLAEAYKAAGMESLAQKQLQQVEVMLKEGGK